MTVLNRHAFPPLLAVGLCGVVLTMWSCTPAASVVGEQETPAPLNGAALEPPVSLPELTLVRSDGRPFTTADTRGRTSLVYFGYTQCADVCPLTLAQFGQVRRSLGAAAEAVDMYFITLDPSRDTPERMQTYLENFPGIVGLLGSDEQLARAQSAFNVIAERRDTGGSDYLLDHTAAIYLVNAASQIQLVYPYGTAPEEIAADLRRL